MLRILKPIAERHRALQGDVKPDDVADHDTVVVELDDVAQRRVRLAAYAEATRPVIIYRFVLPDGAKVAALGQSGEHRDARAQLELMVALIGGGWVKSPGGVAVRIPAILAAKFEAMAGPLIMAYLVAVTVESGG